MQETGFLDHDGVRVAYASVGEGPPLVLPAYWVSHAGDDWTRPLYRAFVEALARGRRVIRYDRPGTGLSDRERPAETMTLDWEVGLFGALLDELELERPALFAVSSGGPIAAVYASRFPERVERVVFCNSYAHGRGLGQPATRDAFTALVRSHWGLGSRMLADVFEPMASADERADLAVMQRSSATPEIAASMLELMYGVDVRSELATLRVPTLVVHREDDAAIVVRNGREIAGLVPGAELVVLPGDAHLPWHGDRDALVAAVAPFLGIAPPEPAAAPTGLEELSPREREVLRFVAEGLSDADIATRLVLSPHTVHRHVANIRRKLGLRSRSAAAALAARAGLV
jgi:pimeloyl-ACP methyl ester carboxylesterase/DNA-binding CsgD family transcriptional regulator